MFNWRQRPPTQEEFIASKVVEKLQEMIRLKDGLSSFNFLLHCQTHWHYVGSRGMTTPDRQQLMKECVSVFQLPAEPDWMEKQNTPYKFFEFILANRPK